MVYAHPWSSGSMTQPEDPPVQHSEEHLAIGETLPGSFDIEGRAQWSPESGSAPIGKATHGAMTSLPRVVERSPKLRVDLRPMPRYLVEDVLGAGGMGEVVLVRDRDIERRVAMKQIRSGGGEVPHLTAHFADEVRALGRLEHPNIVPIYDVGRDDEGRLFFTMKYVEGETIADVLERMMAGDRETLAAWPLARRCDVFVGVLKALDFAHQHGVLHLDVKPENVMVGAHGEVLLVDWGIASTRPDTDGGKVAGSPAYMSPEQARGLPLDARSDVYSAFVLFFELLTLRPYIEATESVGAILAEAREKNPPPRLGSAWVHPHQYPVPMEYRHFVVRGLRNDRDDRIVSASDALKQMNKIRSGEFDASCPITMTKRAQIASARLIEGHQWIMPTLVFGTPIALIAWLVWSFTQ